MQFLKNIVVTMFGVALLAMPNITHAASNTIIAAAFHADWCASCKQLGPTFKMVKEEYEGSPYVEFVKFDKTNEDTSSIAEIKAKAMGLEKHYLNNPKTGFVLLIDKDTKKVFGKLTKEQSAVEMAEAITAAINGEMAEIKGSGSDSMKGSGSGSKMNKGSSMKGSY